MSSHELQLTENQQTALREKINGATRAKVHVTRCEARLAEAIKSCESSHAELVVSLGEVGHDTLLIEGLTEFEKELAPKEEGGGWTGKLLLTAPDLIEPEPI